MSAIDGRKVKFRGNRLGRRAAKIARGSGITPERVQHQLFGQVNLLPVWVWEVATEQLELQVAP